MVVRSKFTAASDSSLYSSTTDPTFYRTEISSSAFAFGALSYRSTIEEIYIYILILISTFFHSSLLLSSPFEEEKETTPREEGRKSGEGGEEGCAKPRSADERSVRFRSLKSVNNSHVEDNEAISGYAPRPRSSFGRELGHLNILRIFMFLLPTFVLFSMDR